MGNPQIKLFFLVVISLCLVTACVIPFPEYANNIQETQSLLNTASLPSATAQLSTATAIVVSATATAIWTSTIPYTPTISSTPTSSIPMVIVNVGTNCREGPGKVYNLLDGLMVGEQAEIVKLAPAGVDYVVIRRPHGVGDCWLWLEHATMTGDTSQLSIATIPPTPTSTITSTPTVTATSTSQSPFAGNWTMVLGGHPYAVMLTETGTSITGTFNTAGGVINLMGTMNADGKTVSGTFTDTAGVGGTFTWHLLDNKVQFNGHGDIGGGSLEWCGYRAGQSAPVPCLAP